MNALQKSVLAINTIVNFPTAFFDRLGLINKEVVYKIRNKDMRFIARGGTEDVAEIAVVASGYEYDINLLKLPKNPIIFDLGGHIGTFSIYMANLLKNKCSIYTYEPDKENFSLLKQNVSLNKSNSVTILNLAISDYVGKGYLKNEDMNTDAYHLETVTGKKPNCTISTIKREMQKNKVKKIDLLKIDIEGGEYKIFLHRESLEYILKNVHYIFMEYHNLDKKYNYSLIKKLIDKNFAVIQERTNTFTLENPNWKKYKS